MQTRILEKPAPSHIACSCTIPCTAIRIRALRAESLSCEWDLQFPLTQFPLTYPGRAAVTIHRSTAVGKRKASLTALHQLPPLYSTLLCAALPCRCWPLWRCPAGAEPPPPPSRRCRRRTSRDTPTEPPCRSPARRRRWPRPRPPAMPAPAVAGPQVHQLQQQQEQEQEEEQQ